MVSNSPKQVNSICVIVSIEALGQVLGFVVSIRGLSLGASAFLCEVTGSFHVGKLSLIWGMQLPLVFVICKSLSIFVGPQPQLKLTRQVLPILCFCSGAIRVLERKYTNLYIHILYNHMCALCRAVFTSKVGMELYYKATIPFMGRIPDTNWFWRSHLSIFFIFGYMAPIRSKLQSYRKEGSNYRYLQVVFVIYLYRCHT